MEAFGVFAVFVVIIVVLVGSIAWHFGRSKSILQQWADKNGYRILQQEYRNFFKGPFFWTSSKGQTVYYVTVSDSAGKVRKGWVRCGGWFLGLLSDNIEVCWDEGNGNRSQ
jgi:hypothetical protein